MDTTLPQQAQQVNSNPTQQVVQSFQNQAANSVAQGMPSQQPTPNPQQPMQQGQPQQSQSQPSQQTAPQSQSGSTPQPGSMQDAMTQLDPNHTPAPTSTTMDVNAGITLGSLLSGNPPATITVSDLQNYINHQNMAQLGHQGNSVNGANPPAGFDRKQAYGYIPGQCTSYAAWYLQQKGIDPSGLGNAKTWATNAAQKGMNVTDTPQSGDVVVWPTLGSMGHVAVVDSVNPDGTINVSEQNYKPGQYSQRSNVSTQGTVYIQPSK